jgi:hypothetical protein
MADKQNLNDQLPADVRRRRHNKAKNYRELYLLPRFVVEENNEKRKLEVKDRTFLSLTRLVIPLLPRSDMITGPRRFSFFRWDWRACVRSRMLFV